MKARREAFLTDMFTVGSGEEAYSVRLLRRDGFDLGGYCREALADILKKHFPGAGRATKTPRAGRRRRTHSKGQT